MEPLCTLLEAVARMEGYPVKGSRANRNNNPGNIDFGKFTIAHGATEGDPRFAVFPTPRQGWLCMQALFRTGYRGLTISQAITRWAPPDENNTGLYVFNVCKWTGLEPSAVIDMYLSLPAGV